MYEIQVADRQSLLSLDQGWIAEIVRTTLAAQQVTSAEIDVAVLDDAAIHVVNRDHLQHDYPTDVISFLYEARWDKGSEVRGQEALRGAGASLDGEILVSAETAQRVAREVGWQPENELTLYFVHGLLHLCGYDDLTPEEQEVMRARERAILQNWNLTPHYHS